MRPETISELIAAVVLGLVAIGSSIALKLDAVTHTTFFAIVASSTGAVSVVFGIRHYFRSQPRFLNIKREDWKEVRTPVQSSEDVRVTIPAGTHKKGKNAKVEFLPDALHGYDTLLYSVNAPNGDIWIYHVPNSFQYPHHVRICRIKITA
jgi:hypothetical protein